MPGSWNASSICRAATLDGASPGSIESGCFWAISLRLGTVSGSATATAIQIAITARGQRTTKSASRRNTHPLEIPTRTHPPTDPTAQAKRPQSPLSATCSITDFMVAI